MLPHQRQQTRKIGKAAGHGGKAGVRQGFRIAKRFPHRLKLAVLNGGHADLSILCLPQPGECAIIRKGIGGIHKGVVVHAFWPVEGERRIQHRHFHLLALARSLPGKQRGSDGLRRRQRRYFVAHQRLHKAGIAICIGLRRGHARCGLHHRIIGPNVPVGPVSSKAGDGAVNQLWVQCGTALIGKAQLGECAGAEIFDENIGPAQQILKFRVGIRVFQIQRNAALSAVHADENRRHIAFACSHHPHRIARRRFQLELVCPLIRKPGAGHRARYDLAEVQHLDTCKWSHNILPALRCRAYGHSESWLFRQRVMSRSLVSGRKNQLTTKAMATTPTVYQRPANGLPVFTTISCWMKGRKPPK